MFETEVAHANLDSAILPKNIQLRFINERTITHLSYIKWEEHCTECAWPTCYTSCSLYNPRNDENCRRTVDGFSPLSGISDFGIEVVRVKFLRWANLTAICNVSVGPFKEVRNAEGLINRMSGVASSLPNLGKIIGKPGLPSRAVRLLKDRFISRKYFRKEPNCFVMEIFNPSEVPVDLSLDIAPLHHDASHIPFKRLLNIGPGFQRVRIPFSEIRPHVSAGSSAHISINPNILTKEEEGLTLFFGVLSFAYDPELDQVTSNKKKIKVVIWDLDNTVWDGTLIEDGSGNVKLKSNVFDTIVALDGRGIINSVVSKNHEKDAIAELKRLNLSQYFVFPVIGWGPKSEAVRQVVQSFNVGEDTVAFIDDQPFEREEVLASNPKVRVYRHDQVSEILKLDEFDVPITSEAKMRRAFYQTEEVRLQARQASGNYLSFLKQSNIRVRIGPATMEQIDRIHELVQRTNQMNFSGTRYSKDDLRRTLEKHECYLIDAEDNYGKYGYVGFAVIQSGATPRVIDLAFSCRVQSKRVEHAVLIFLMERYASRASALEIFYRGTEKNARIAQVFSDLACSEVSRVGNDFVYRSDLSRIPENDVVSVLT